MASQSGSVPGPSPGLGSFCPKVHRDGFTQLSGDRGDVNSGTPRKANVVFVHGLKGHPRHTWESGHDKVDDPGARARSSSERKGLRLPRFSRSKRKGPGTSSTEGPAKVFWPYDFLAQELSDVNVWTYGYNADVIESFMKPNNQSSVSQHGENLAVKIKRNLGDELPIIWIAHSLGGIIVKDALHRSDVCRSLTTSVIFLGTPHRGSSSAEWATIASNLASVCFLDSDTRLVKALERNSEVLDNIHTEFAKIANVCQLNIHSFQEGRGMSGVKGFHQKVVPDYSSKMGIPHLEIVERIDANHMQMAKCSTWEDPQYRDILSVLEEHLRRVPRNVTEEGPNANAMKYNSIERTNSKEADPKPRCYIPLSPNERFVGREAILDQLKRKLFDDNCKSVALKGLGGIGKTQVALRFAYWVEENKKDYRVFWVSALSGASFQEGCSKIVELLDVNTTTRSEDPKESVRRILSEKSSGKWLLIVDNADDMDTVFGSQDKPDAICDFLPDSKDGRTLFTTRFHKLAASAADDLLELGELDQQEGRRVLEKWLREKDLLQDESLVIELLKELTYLPLAISQAATYIKQNQSSITEYLALLQGTDKEKVSLLSRGLDDRTRYQGSQRSQRSQNAVATTFLVSFKQILDSDPAAARLLQFMSCLEPKAIPRSILPNFESNEEWVNAIGTLHAYNFVTAQKDRDMFDMHSLVHLATGVWVEKEKKTTEVAKQAMKHLASMTDYGDQAFSRAVLPHALRVLRGGQSVNVDERYDVYQSASLSLPFNVKIQEEWTDWARSQYSAAEERWVRPQIGLAHDYQSERRVKEAIEVLERALEPHAKSAEGVRNRLEIKRELVLAYCDSGQVENATDTLSELVAQGWQRLEQAHERCKQSCSQPEDFAELYEEYRELTRDMKALGETRARFHKLVSECGPERDREMKVLDEAIKRCDLATVSYRPYRENTSDLPHLQLEEAEACFAIGRVKDAIGLAESALAASRNSSDTLPIKMCLLHGFLANAYEVDGLLDKAIESHESLLTEFHKIVGVDHPGAAAQQAEIANLCQKTGQTGKAVRVLEQAEAALPEDESFRDSVRADLVRAYMQDGQMNRAAEFLEHWAKILRALPEGHARRLKWEEEVATLKSELASATNAAN